MKRKSELLSLKYVGPAVVKALHMAGIISVQDLRKTTTEQLCACLQEVTSNPVHPCLQDVFSAAIHEARTGERVPWWFWSKQRKESKKKFEW